MFEQQLEVMDYPIIKEKSPEERIRDYVIRVLKTGFSEEKQEILALFKTRFILKDKQIFHQPFGQEKLETEYS